MSDVTLPPEKKIISAAGTVVWRPGSTKGQVELLLVHRPRYNDWTFPKGKVDPGEELPTTAVRETLEEGNIAVQLGVPLPQMNYRITAGIKQVSWWLATPVNAKHSFKANSEVDKVRWVSPREARSKVSYSHDRDMIDAVEDLIAAGSHRSRTLIVMRHAEALDRESWTDDDRLRPLTESGLLRVKSLVPVLRSFGVNRVVSSPATRCLQTVEPLVAESKAKLASDERLYEGSAPELVQQVTDAAADRKKPVLICTHRPVLPGVFAAMRLNADPLDPGTACVVHHRRGRVVATELL